MKYFLFFLIVIFPLTLLSAQEKATGEVVIVGKAIAIEQVEDDGPISEHSPELQLVTVEVKKILKVTSKNGLVYKVKNNKVVIVVQQAGSQDVMYYGTKRLGIGDTGKMTMTEFGEHYYIGDKKNFVPVHLAAIIVKFHKEPEDKQISEIESSFNLITIKRPYDKKMLVFGYRGAQPVEKVIQELIKHKQISDAESRDTVNLQKK